MLNDTRAKFLNKLKVSLFIFGVFTVLMLGTTVWQALNPNQSLRVWCCVMLCWFVTLTYAKYRAVQLYEYDSEQYIK